MSASAPPRDASRLGFVDDARGIAVVLMILWHTVDGWLAPAFKSGQGFEVLRSFGGLAAPTFLALAGAGATLKLCADSSRGRNTVDSVRELGARGLQVLVAGYALRVFMWMVDGSAILEMHLAPAWSLLVLGLAAMTTGLSRVGAKQRFGLTTTTFGILAYAAGIVVLHAILPTQVVRLARVDVLQAIGASLALIACAEPLLRLSRRPWLAILIGLVVAGATQSVEALLPGPLPSGVAAYLGRWPTGDGPNTAMFSLFPWLGYALLGAAVGTVWFRGAMAGRTPETVLAVLCVGALCAALTNENVGFARALLQQVPTLARAVRMVHKVGFALSLAGISYVLTQITGRFPLRSLGKTSMLVYWVHLELVYGICGKSLAHSLDHPRWAVAFVALTVAMAGLAHVRLHPPKWPMRRVPEATIPLDRAA